MPAVPLLLYWPKQRKEVSVGEDMNGWLERFGLLDAEEEEAIDQSPEYSALLREETSNPERRSYRYRALLSEQAQDPAGAE
jgi:hypothetical protein